MAASDSWKRDNYKGLTFYSTPQYLAAFTSVKCR